MKSQMSPDELDDLLAEEARLEPTAPARRERLWSRLEQSLPPIPPAPAPDAPAPAPAPIPATAAPLVGAKGLLGVALAVGVAGVGWLVTTAHTPTPSAAPSVAALSASAPSSALPAAPFASAALSAPTPLASIASAAATTRPSSAPTASTARLEASSEDPNDPDLLRERALLGSARRALGEGRLDAAAAALDRHAHDFPSGRLREERAALRVQLLQARGDAAGAEKARRELEAAYPESIFLERPAP